jgi:hypothetical protein
MAASTASTRLEHRTKRFRKGSGSAAGVGAWAVATGACALMGIGWSCYEIRTYKVGKPSLLLTRCGKGLADSLFPLSVEITVTPVRRARSSQSPIIGPGHPIHPKE